MPDALLHAVAGGQSLLGSDWPVLCKYLEEAEGSMVLPVAMGDGSSLSPSPNTHTHTLTHIKTCTQSSPVVGIYSYGHRVERINHTRVHTHTYVNCKVDTGQGVDMLPLQPLHDLSPHLWVTPANQRSPLPPSVCHIHTHENQLFLYSEYKHPHEPQCLQAAEWICVATKEDILQGHASF